MLGRTLVLLLGILAAGSASAQITALDEPADSPLWWALVPNFDLRADHLSEEKNRERHLDGVEIGRTEALAQDQHVVFYLDTHRDAPLVPFWRAFDNFARTLEVRGTESIEAKLLEYLGEPDVLTAERIAMAYNKMLHARIAEAKSVLRGLTAKADQRHRGRDVADSMLRNRDTSGLADFLGLTEQQAAEYVSLATSPNRARTFEEVAFDLRSALGERSWWRFGHYLLNHHAQGLGIYVEVTNE